MVYCFRQKQHLSLSVEKAWDFFSNPANLATITPPKLNFQITSELPEGIYAGLIITYHVTPLFGIPLSWTTEITQCRKPDYFVDYQLSGPYKIWHHQHHFRPLPSGVEMVDIVYYEIGYGWLDPVLNRLVIGPQLNHIFAYRKKILMEKFGLATRP